ncbi:hypothetical protein D3C78_1046190 [compost metagenome]
MQGLLGLIPQRFRAHIVVRPCRQLDFVIEAEYLINVVDQGNHSANLVLDLLREYEEMGIILAEGTNPHHAVKRPGKLVTVYLPEL